MVPVLSEVEETQNKEDEGPFRYALAVSRSQDGGKYRNLSALRGRRSRGRRSCHGSIRSLAGWNAPMAKLRELKVTGGPTCGLTLEMSQFFGNKSCVAGV